MTAIEQAIRQTEQWVESIDRERDELAQTLSSDALSDIARAFIPERLARLEVERAEALELLRSLEALRFRPELMFAVRPKRMLKVPLRRPAEERKRA